MPKALSIGRRGIGQIQNVVVAAHEIAYARGDREVDIWLVLGAPGEVENSIDKRACQYRELLLHPWTSQHVAAPAAPSRLAAP